MQRLGHGYMVDCTGVKTNSILHLRFSCTKYSLVSGVSSLPDNQVSLLNESALSSSALHVSVRCTNVFRD